MLWIAFGAAFVAIVAFASAWRARRRLEDRADLLDLLARACRRGLVLPPLLDAYARGCSLRLRSVALRLAASLESGASLADALERLPRRAMQRVVIGATRAAEGTPRLAEVLEHAADAASERLAFRHRVLRASLYPLLVGLLALGLHHGILAALEGQWNEMPGLSVLGPTTASGGVVASVVVVCGAVAAWLLPALLDRLGLLPGIGRLDTARVLSTAGLLVEGGVPAAPALERASAATESRRRRRHIHAAIAAVEAGAPTERLWQPFHLSAVDRLRLDTAGARLGPVLSEIATASLARWRERGRRWLLFAAPATIVAVALLVFLDFRIVMSWLEAARGDVGLW